MELRKNVLVNLVNEVMALNALLQSPVQQTRHQMARATRRRRGGSRRPYDAAHLLSGMKMIGKAGSSSERQEKGRARRRKPHSPSQQAMDVARRKPFRPKNQSLRGFTVSNRAEPSACMNSNEPVTPASTFLDRQAFFNAKLASATAHGRKKPRYIFPRARAWSTAKLSYDDALERAHPFRSDCIGSRISLREVVI